MNGSDADFLLHHSSYIRAKSKKMIAVTGAGGFIGSTLIEKLNAHRFINLIAVDSFDKPHKSENLWGRQIREKVGREALFDWIDTNADEVEFIFHLGARTNTQETDAKLLSELNTEYSKKLWQKCCDFQIPMIYASSAATYGDGEHGFSDDHAVVPKLKPLNAYAQSKHNFDLWALQQKKKPLFWAGLKFFNVYGAQEAHKGAMASMAYQMRKQIEETATVRLFKSNDATIPDGDQRRDFIPVESVCEIMIWSMHHRKNSGIYNVGTGRACSFNEIATRLFAHYQKPKKIEYIEMPGSLSHSYQNFTQADVKKISSIGLPMELMTSQF